MIPEELLQLLACPKCADRPPLRIEGERLVCDLCDSSFRIVDGVPHLLPEEAEPRDKTHGK